MISTVKTNMVIQLEVREMQWVNIVRRTKPSMYDQE